MTARVRSVPPLPTEARPDRRRTAEHREARARRRAARRRAARRREVQWSAAAARTPARPRVARVSIARRPRAIEPSATASQAHASSVSLVPTAPRPPIASRRRAYLIRPATPPSPAPPAPFATRPRTVAWSASRKTTAPRAKRARTHGVAPGARRTGHARPSVCSATHRSAIALNAWLTATAPRVSSVARASVSRTIAAPAGLPARVRAERTAAVVRRRPAV